MPSVAFFPWLSLPALVSIGEVRLIPYRCGKEPGDGAVAKQSDLDGVFAAYALRKNRPIEQAVLLEVGDWCEGQDADDDTRERLFRARELLAFTGLAGRKLFRGEGYCGFDNFAFYIQNYVAGNTRHLSFDTRRRDGGAKYTWGADEFAFLKPLHVDENARPAMDFDFFAALLQADAVDQAPFPAIFEFNRANSDSLDVPVHTEVVMMKSAFEYFLGVGHDCNEMISALLPMIPSRAMHIPLDGPLATRWPTANKKGVAIRPVEAWGREFCLRRNESAHGANRGANPNFVWSVHAHLAFASVLLPLLVKQQMAQLGFYQMDQRDTIQLEVIESYVFLDPFAVPVTREDRIERPWSKVYSEIVCGELLRRELESRMQEIRWDELPPT